MLKEQEEEEEGEEQKSGVCRCIDSVLSLPAHDEKRRQRERVSSVTSNIISSPSIHSISYDGKGIPATKNE